MERRAILGSPPCARAASAWREWGPSVGRLSSADVRQTIAAERALLCHPHGEGELLAAIVRELDPLLSADLTQAYTLELFTEGVALRDYASTRLTRAAVRRGFDTAIAAGKGSRFGSYNPLRPERAQRDVALRSIQLHVRARGRHGPLSQVLPEYGLSVAHQMRMLVCDGTSLLAWVGGYREDGFTPREVAILNRLAPTLKRRLSVERLLDDAEIIHSALSAALEQLARPAMVVSRRGSIDYMNESAGAIWEASPEVLREKIRLVLRDGKGEPSLDAVPLSHSSGGGWLLLDRTSQPQRSEAACAILARRHGLTKRETEVLSLVIRGATNLQTACALECSERTVEQHVGRLLGKLDCENRASLGARVRDVDGF